MFARKAKRQKIKYDPEEEARLEQIVFGDTKDVVNNFINKSDDSEDDDDDNDEELSSISRVQKREVVENSDDSEVNSETDNDTDISEETETPEQNKTQEKLKTAWIDEDDERYSVAHGLALQKRKLPDGRPEKTYNELIKNKFQNIVGTPKWSKLETTDKDDGSDSDSEILKHNSCLKTNKSVQLPKNIIEIKALSNINKETQNEGKILTSLQFHESSTVAFVAGLRGILSVFQIDGKENNKLQSIQFNRFCINDAKFLNDGNEILAGSRNCQYAQIYNLISGKIYKCNLPHGITNMKKFEVSPDGKMIVVMGRRGDIHLLTSKTKEWIATLKMNERCSAATFSLDSKTLITHGDSEEIYVWDLNSRVCVNKAIDDGCISNGAIAMSRNGQFLATGSKQGAVNIYETSSVLKSRCPQPLKVVLNLVTPITSLKFNPTSEILAIASEHKPNAFKMVHIPSFNVFSNFPSFRTVMHCPLAIDFSPGSAFLGISNNNGNAYLYRLKHYGNY